MRIPAQSLATLPRTPAPILKKCNIKLKQRRHMIVQYTHTLCKCYTIHTKCSIYTIYMHTNTVQAIIMTWKIPTWDLVHNSKCSRSHEWHVSDRCSYKSSYWSSSAGWIKYIVHCTCSHVRIIHVYHTSSHGSSHGLGWVGHWQDGAYVSQHCWHSLQWPQNPCVM